MANPTTKADLLTRMREGHQEFQAVMARIPDDRMHEIALYDNWTMKDFIAHIASWEQNTADRIAALKRGEKVSSVDVDAMNAQFLVKYRDMPLQEVRDMEAAAFAAMEQQVLNATEEELFDASHFPGRKTGLVTLIAGDSYGHYPEHLPDVKMWMKNNNLA